MLRLAKILGIFFYLRFIYYHRGTPIKKKKKKEKSLRYYVSKKGNKNIKK